jgi:hypothetical protein
MGDNMTKTLLSISFVVLLIYSCGPKSVSYEDATKWHNDCFPYLQYHPGDWYAVEDECHEECTEYKDTCAKWCIEMGYPIAEHVEGGYYSDGSYYASCENLFENIHPTGNKYEKTQWQKDRDECMELTFENVKLTWWDRKHRSHNRWLKRATSPQAEYYYKSCLRERGY